jgi:NAD(P)-dependent dehydrogenase (short-subunit alcohol dehydrogenase family)
VSWVLSAYAIVFAAVLVPAGRLADQYGRKRTLLTGVALFTIASAMASLAPTLDVLIAARAVQATGAAMIVSTSLGLLYPSFPERQHTLVVGIWAGVAGIAGSAGPPVGGLLVTAGWRWIFLINLPIGLATIAAGIVVLPEVRQAAAARLPDPASAISLLLAVSLLVLATVEGPGWGWGSGRTISLFAAATAMAVVTVQRSLRAAAPVIEKELFRSRQFSPDTVALLLYFTGFSIFLLGGALFMQDVWHFSALRAGVGIAPAPVASVGFALNAGPIQARFGRTMPAVAGTIAMAAAAVYWLITVSGSPSYWSAMFPGLVLMGVSGGLSQAPMFAAAVTLAPERATTGSAVLSMTRQIGSAIGVALLVALTAMHDDPAGFKLAWAVQAGAGTAAAATLFFLRPRNGRRLGRSRALSHLAARGATSQRSTPSTKETHMKQNALVTAGTRGIGLEVALGLAQSGYSVTVVGRDPEHGEQATARIGNARFIQADLSVLADVRSLGERVAAEGPLHLLVNNVGGMWSNRWQTADGIEASFAVNHLAPIVLTEALIGALQAGRPSRIVNVTSSSIQAALLNGIPSYDEVEAGEYFGMAVSGRAKLAHLSYTMELARRLRGSGVSVFAADPGAAATPNAAEMTPEILPPAVRFMWDQIWQGVQHPAAEAARSVVFAATDPSLSGETGLAIDPDCQASDALTGTLSSELTSAVGALTERTLKTIL